MVNISLAMAESGNDGSVPEQTTGNDGSVPEQANRVENITEETTSSEQATTQTNDSDPQATYTPVESAQNEACVQPDLSDHKPSIAPWPMDYSIHAQLITSAGIITCELFAGTHPMTVLNFISLATGKPAWTDAKGIKHHTPYYEQLPFTSRVKGAYVSSGLRDEGTDFVIQDERCKSHPPIAGSIAMIQNYPGNASTQFILMPRDNPKFKNMYPVFGQCQPIDTIDKLTREDATLERIDILSE